MRAISLGSVVLGFSIVLLSWDASKRFTHVHLNSLVASFGIGGIGPAPSAGQAPSIGARGLEGPSDLGTSTASSSPVESTRPMDSPDRAAPRSTAETRRRLGNTSGLAVREFTPGSKAHAEAIASSIASNEYRNTVEPLARLYFAFFDRVADYEGLNYYIDERDGDVSLQSIADEFAGSTEFRLRYGALDNAAFIDRLYRNVFDAVPDSAQRAYWIGQLEAGMSRGNVMLAFSESGAFRTLTSNEVFVTMAYAEALRRAPDAAGFAHWVSFLEAGNSREAMIAGLLGGARNTR